MTFELYGWNNDIMAGMQMIQTQDPLLRERLWMIDVFIEVDVVETKSLLEDEALKGRNFGKRWCCRGKVLAWGWEFERYKIWQKLMV